MIRIASCSDWSRIIDIYNQAVATGFSTADIEPVSIESRRQWLEEHSSHKYPIYVEEIPGEIRGWCSISPYRAGRTALRYTAEISYYVAYDRRRQGIGASLIEHAINETPSFGIKTLFAIVLDRNVESLNLLEKLKFEKWGHMPNIADFGGVECGHIYMGRRVD